MIKIIKSLKLELKAKRICLNSYKFFCSGRKNYVGDYKKDKILSEEEISDFEDENSKENINRAFLINEDQIEDFENEIMETSRKKNNTSILKKENFKKDAADLHSHFIMDRNFKCKYLI